MSYNYFVFKLHYQIIFTPHPKSINMATLSIIFTVKITVILHILNKPSPSSSTYLVFTFRYSQHIQLSAFKKYYLTDSNTHIHLRTQSKSMKVNINIPLKYKSTNIALHDAYTN